jgi:two-component system, OmpR family, alkaline phosphatase synthesis response regulator PhoP
MSRILVVEDEVHLAQGLRFNLEAEGHSVHLVGDGESALDLLLRHAKPGPQAEAEARTESNQEENEKPQSFDAMVLDVMLPGIDGFAVASELRSAKQFIPVLMLTARGRPEDVLKGFASGADDYLPKPFELPILLARLQGLLRRREWMAQSQAEGLNGKDATREKLDGGNLGSSDSAPEEVTEYSVYSFSGRTIDFGKLELRVKGNTIQLTLMEAEFLRYLIENAGSPVSRKSILEEVWGLREDTDTRAIDNFIVRLRRYIENNPSKPEHLLTVRGVGYRFIAEPDKS